MSECLSILILNHYEDLSFFYMLKYGCKAETLVVNYECLFQQVILNLISKKWSLKMNFLKIKVEVDAEQLAQRKRVISVSSSRVVKGKNLRRNVVKRIDTNNEENSGDLYNIEDELKNLCEEYNNGLKSSGYFEIVEAKGENLSIYSYIADVLYANSHLSDLFKKLDLKAVNIKIDEVTFKEFEDNIDFHKNKRDLCESLGIDGFLRSHWNDDYTEKILNCSSKIKINAETYIGRESLFNELTRIYSSPIKNKFMGHPVHYYLETDDYEECQETCETLLEALYHQKRITSKRFSVVNFEEEVREDLIDSLYRIGSGGARIINATSYNSDEQRNLFKRGNDLYLPGLCRMINKYKNHVLTIICFPRKKDKVKNEFLNYLSEMALVDLSENVVSHSQACDYLKFLAKRNKTRIKKSLIANLEQAEPLTPKSLRELFTAWYEHDLRHSVFPQYKDIQIVQKSLYKDANYSALNELNNLIGLSKAKQLINRIINYNKIQKLISERSDSGNHCSMHMVFSGNPGSAKTTVARLFAKIMKEKAVLSTGVFVEVGRADLVGKYVGSTAPLVKSKFAEAKGGVLFIDEAYSLLDDKKGLYGDEAINTIVQEMENNREDIIVIFTGYKDEMKSFIERNPGLQSRIAHQVEFEDYSAEELCKIAEHIARKEKFTFSDEALKKLNLIFEKAKNTLNFGNGRFARNIFEKARMIQAERLSNFSYDSLSDKDLFTLTADDIEFPDYISSDKKHIGFSI